MLVGCYGTFIERKIKKLIEYGHFLTFFQEQKDPFFGLFNQLISRHNGTIYCGKYYSQNLRFSENFCRCYGAVCQIYLLRK